MKRSSRWQPKRAGLLLAVVALPGALLAQADRIETSIDGGGGRASGGSYSLDVSFGQIDTQILNGGGYALELGFQREAVVPDGQIFKDGFETESTP